MEGAFTFLLYFSKNAVGWEVDSGVVPTFPSDVSLQIIVSLWRGGE